MAGGIERLRALWARLRGAENARIRIEEALSRGHAAAVTEADDAATLLKLCEVAGTDAWPHDADPIGCVDRLIERGRADVALAHARRLVARLPADQALRLAVAERLHARMDFTAAEALLEPLREGADRKARLRALFLLAEAAEHRGDLAAAQRLYEHILAEDIDYPNARSRAARLATARGPAPARAPALAPTILAVESSGTRASRYRLLRELGRGSAASVYLARDEELGRDVALKILHPQFYGASHADARTRFFDEARIAASLRHPGIVAVYDVDEPLRLIAMEHCAGGTLRERLRQAGPFAPSAAAARMVELLRVLAAVHARGVIHHDLKPGNLLFREEALVVADFGSAHLAKSSQNPQAGTLLYMSPEQRRGFPATAQDDLWSAGAILYEMLVGAPPFSADALLRQPLPALSLPAAIPEALATLLRRFLSPELASRFPSAAAALEEVVRSAA